MEVPIHLAIDTTDAWEKSDTILGESELAIEIVETGPTGKPAKIYLLLGDGKPVGPGMERLRVKPCHIAGLAENLLALEETDRLLQNNIDSREVFHDDTLRGKGTKNDVLSITPGGFDGITSRARLSPDPTGGNFALPEDFIYAKLSFVEINGLMQEPGVDYSIDEENGVVIFPETPDAQDNVTVYYTQKKQEEE